MSFEKKFNSRPYPTADCYKKQSIEDAIIRAAGLDPADKWKYLKGRLPEEEISIWEKTLSH